MHKVEIGSQLILRDQLSVATTRHPPCALDMRRVHRAPCVWVVSGIKAKHKSDRFAPIRAFRCGIKQPQIGDEMRFIIVRDVFGLRRNILEGRGLNHGQLGFDSLAFELASSTKSFATLRYAAYPQTGNAIFQLR